MRRCRRNCRRKALALRVTHRLLGQRLPCSTDDYEEGTWTPSLTSDTLPECVIPGVPTRYLRVGTVVYVDGGAFKLPFNTWPLEWL